MSVGAQVAALQLVPCRQGSFGREIRGVMVLLFFYSDFRQLQLVLAILPPPLNHLAAVLIPCGNASQIR